MAYFNYMLYTITEPLSEIPVEFMNQKKRRTLWLGDRKIAPDLSFSCVYNSKDSLISYLKEENIFPTLLVWISTHGERKYSLVTYDKK